MYTMMVPHQNIHISARGPLHPYILLGLPHPPGTQPAPAWRQYAVLQHRCTLCTVPVYKPLCMQHGVMNNMELSRAENQSYSIAATGVHAEHQILPGPGRISGPCIGFPGSIENQKCQNL
jgi:hypothetical protein